jgi:hypothetical protein
MTKKRKQPFWNASGYAIFIIVLAIVLLAWFLADMSTRVPTSIWPVPPVAH